MPTLAWAAATALATTSLLSPSRGATKAEEAAAAASPASSSGSGSCSSGGSENLYSLPAPTGLFSSPSSSSPSSKSLPRLTLYQYEVCPFCCKVKAVLDFYKIPYQVVEVSPLTKRQLKWGDHRKVPVLALGGKSGEEEEEKGGASSFAPPAGAEVLADSSLIISRLAAEAQAAGLGPARGAGGSGKSSGGSGKGSSSWVRRGGGDKAASPPSLSKEASWRKWVDGRLVKVITVNIYRTAGEAWQTFDYIAETGSFGSDGGIGGAIEKGAARVVGAGMMWAIAGRLAKRYGVEGEPRAALEQAGREWTEGALRRDDDSSAAASPPSFAPFAGGDSPDLADLSAFGVWRAVSKTDSFADAMRGNGELRAWYGRMERAVGASSRVE